MVLPQPLVYCVLRYTVLYSKYPEKWGISVLSGLIYTESIKIKEMPVIARKMKGYHHDSKHYHTHIQLWYVAEGELTHVVDDKEYIQVPGSCIAVFPHTSHRIETPEHKEIPEVFSVDISEEQMQERGWRLFAAFNRYARFEEKKIPFYHTFTGAEKQKADSLIFSMVDEFDKHENMSYARLCRECVEFMRLLCSDSSIASEEGFVCIKNRGENIAKAVKYITKHYSEKLTLRILANEATMSERMFTENFRAVTGVSPIEFVMTYRISRARHALSTTNKPIAQIAKEQGFTTAERLSHEFKKRFNMTPRQWRKMSQNQGIQADIEWHEEWKWMYKREREGESKKGRY